MPYLHPQNETIWEVFGFLRTQINAGGMGGFCGYDFSLAPTVFKALDIPPSEWADILAGLNDLNAIALEITQRQQAESS